ncbi:MAG: hypothetical protein JWO43_461 [Candidatus Adlerbacteria bacterium]|nr:hypothetical protein [Candidatus Adlerbacteria bacterium]
MNVKMLATHGYMTIDYPRAMRAAVEESMRDWQNFCRSPQVTKNLFKVGDRHIDGGYVDRRDEGTDAEQKEYFHVSKDRMPHLMKIAAACGMPAFIKHLDTLLSETTPVVLDCARAIGQEFNMPKLHALAEQGRNAWTFRFLHYIGAVQKGLLAKPHIDRKEMSLHLCETHTGAQYLTRDLQWKPLDVDAGKTVLFPSAGLQHHSGGRLKALCHQVVADNVTDGEDRYSMVLFADFLPDVEFLPQQKWEEPHPPGFNYTMPQKKFVQMFVSH